MLLALLASLVFVSIACKFHMASLDSGSIWVPKAGKNVLKYIPKAVLVSGKERTDVNVIKLFFFSTDSSEKYAGGFIPFKFVQTSLIFASKARTLQLLTLRTGS